jgi:riboflavin kinase/FMN adenylyltransferase
MRLLPADPAGTVVTVGTFDGVHLGHLAVLREIVARAAGAGRKSVLVTFEPHPLEVVNPQAAPPLLTTGPERREVLALTGLDYVVFLRFDKRLAAYSPEQFVREVLIGRCAMRELVIGHDHGFGRGRSGDVETLRRLGASDGFATPSRARRSAAPSLAGTSERPLACSGDRTRSVGGSCAVRAGVARSGSPRSTLGNSPDGSCSLPMACMRPGWSGRAGRAPGC